MGIHLKNQTERIFTVMVISSVTTFLDVVFSPTMFLQVGKIPIIYPELRLEESDERGCLLDLVLHNRKGDEPAYFRQWRIQATKGWSVHLRHNLFSKIVWSNEVNRNFQAWLNGYEVCHPEKPRVN